MRLAISNIAWDTSEDEKVAKLLTQYEIDAIDIAPGKYFPEPTKATDEKIARVKNWWAERGIQITGMQALLFGTEGLNVFGTPQTQKKMLQHLTAVARIGAGLGATRLVFGSPKNRDRTGLNDEQAMEIATPFFQRLGDIAQSYGVLFCLEPNPPCYGANFMRTSHETALVVHQIGHPSICMQLDSGAITINKEDIQKVLASSSNVIGHIHASEPNLVPLGDAGTDHGSIGKLLQEILPFHIVTIEMIVSKNEASIVAIERALRFAVHHYRNGSSDKVKNYLKDII
jgi:D-psicose/D-tagatose/L-ribulose 3-epimerase